MFVVTVVSLDAFGALYLTPSSLVYMYHHSNIRLYFRFILT